MLVSKQNKSHSRTAMFSVDGAKKDWSNLQKFTFTKNPFLTKASTETFSAEFKHVVLKINEFEKYKKGNLIKSFPFFDILGFQHKEQKRNF